MTHPNSCSGRLDWPYVPPCRLVPGGLLCGGSCALPVAGAALPGGLQFTLHLLVARSVGLRRCKARLPQLAGRRSLRSMAVSSPSPLSRLHLRTHHCMMYTIRVETGDLLAGSESSRCNNNIQRVHQSVTAGERERLDFDAWIDRSETGRPVVHANAGEKCSMVAMRNVCQARAWTGRRFHQNRNANLMPSSYTCIRIRSRSRNI